MDEDNDKELDERRGLKFGDVVDWLGIWAKEAG
jgi:hypothetical protein